MNDIILSMQNGEPVVSSRQIAESFEKRHDHVMRDIEDIMRGLPKNVDTPMFYKTEYVHEQESGGLNMEQIITLKVDLEHPNEAHNAINKAVEAYEKSKNRWDAFEINEAKSRARDILYNLCNEGYSMIWTVTDGAVGLSIWADSNEPCVGQCYMTEKGLHDIWVERLVALCIATGQEVPKFITDKAGECW